MLITAVVIPIDPRAATVIAMKIVVFINSSYGNLLINALKTMFDNLKARISSCSRDLKYASSIIPSVPLSY